MRRDLKAHVRALVDQAPPLSSDQRLRLGALLSKPGPGCRAGHHVRGVAA